MICHNGVFNVAAISRTTIQCISAGDRPANACWWKVGGISRVMEMQVYEGVLFSKNLVLFNGTYLLCRASCRSNGRFRTCAALGFVTDEAAFDVDDARVLQVMLRLKQSLSSSPLCNPCPGEPSSSCHLILQRRVQPTPPSLEKSTSPPRRGPSPQSKSPGRCQRCSAHLDKSRSVFVWLHIDYMVRKRSDGHSQSKFSPRLASTCTHPVAKDLGYQEESC